MIKSAQLCEAHYWRLRKHGSLGHGIVAARKAFGTGTIDKNGYRLVWRNGKKLLEHRVVMEGIIGRPLLPSETVHHVNGKRSDNRPKNLELWCRNHGPGQRVSDMLKWAEQIIATYANLPLFR